MQKVFFFVDATGTDSDPFRHVYFDEVYGRVLSTSSNAYMKLRIEITG